MFFDFTSAFNTIQPELLGDKLQTVQVEAPLGTWVTDYLTGRPQYVRLQGCVSDMMVSNTGAPQGTVLAPFLFTLYTSDSHLQKFPDDSTIVRCVRRGQEEEYRRLISDFVVWCNQNHMQLNVTKTKEMVVDFRRTKTPITPVSIGGEKVELVQSYKYLGVYLDSRLDWSVNTEAIYRKSQSRLYFLRRLRSFSVNAMQNNAECVLSVSGGKCSLLRCRLLGQQH
ncbi:hypothetical protein LDENG_00200380 [Lucifuga dentata]|nr:hypothetical protein LDENG_00200380 [Lucifuga dentata]